MKKTAIFLTLAACTCIGAGAVAASGTGWLSSTMQSTDSLGTGDGEIGITPEEPEVVTPEDTAGIEPGTDCTYLLTNPTFTSSTGEGWTWETLDNVTSFNKSGGSSAFPCAEAYGGYNANAGFMFNVYQAIEGVPDGVYSLTVNAFYRPGNNGTFDGSEQVPAYIYINDSKTPVQHIMNGATSESANGWVQLEGFGVSVPNNMAAASDAFSKGMYSQTVTGFVQGGKMTIGIQKLTSTLENQCWCLWSNFKLVYEGQSLDAINAEIESTLSDVDAFVENNELNSYGYGLYKEITDKLYAALESQDSDEKSALLSEALSQFEQLREIHALLQASWNAYDELAVVFESNPNPSDAAVAEFDKCTELVNSMDDCDAATLAGYVEYLNTAKYKVRVPDCSNASAASPIDMTSLIVNNSFETGNLTGWNYNNGDDTRVVYNGNSTYTISNADGNYVFNTWASGVPTGGFWISQVVPYLPAGTYRLTALAASDKDNRIVLTATPQTDDAITAYSDTVAMPYDKTRGTDISVVFYLAQEENTLDISMSGDCWFKADNFRLEYFSTDSISVPAKQEFFVVDTFEDWTSDNHADGSTSTNEWKINAVGQDKIEFDYAVSSEEGCDWITIILTSPSGQNTQLVRVSGTQESHVEVALTEEGQYTLTATYSKDGSANHGTDNGAISSFNHLMANPVAPAKNYLATIEASFPALAAELSPAITAAEAAEEENKVEACKELSLVLSQVRAAVNIYPALTDLIAQANALIENLTEDVPELAEAIAKASDINPETSASAEYQPAYENLKYQVRLASASVVPMDAWAFNTSREYTVDGLKYYLDTEHGIAQFNGIYGTWNQSEFVLPAVITVDGDAYTVVSMENRYQYSQNNITSVVLPLSLRRIGQYAFRYFRSLTSLDIPANVEVFGSQVFYGCDNENINISIKMNPITPPALEGDLGGYSKKKIIVPDGTLHAYRLANQWSNCVLVSENPVTVTVDVADPGELGRLVLDDAGYLQEVNKLVVSGELNNDDWTNIKNMSNLVAIDMSGLKNTSIPNRQFYGKWAIEEAIISGKCATIGDYAFYQTGLKEVVIPEGTECLGICAFYQCDKAATLTLPSTLKSIARETFRKMSKIEAVEIPNL